MYMTARKRETQKRKGHLATRLAHAVYLEYPPLMYDNAMLGRRSSREPLDEGALRMAFWDEALVKTWLIDSGISFSTRCRPLGAPHLLFGAAEAITLPQASSTRWKPMSIS